MLAASIVNRANPGDGGEVRNNLNNPWRAKVVFSSLAAVGVIIMPLLPVQPTPVPVREDPVALRFNHLAAHWHQATDHLSSMSAASSHSAYREIIGLGPPVIPLLLNDMVPNETHWFRALRELTGADPAPLSAAAYGTVVLTMRRPVASAVGNKAERQA
jgi:hypothetical protein